jgi:UDP-2,3-diacylglucosamine pyrophosphatase LpxH
VDAFIVSDLHLGSSKTRHHAFAEFIDRLPGGAMLVLNGDIANDATKHQLRDAEGQAILDQVRRESARRRVVWLGGNNDTDYQPEDPGHIEFRNELAFGKDLYVCHGHRFLTLLGETQALQKAACRFCRLFHRDREETLHMADYLRRVPPLYRLACWVVSRRAVHYARRHGYAAITCGHTHHAEDITIKGVRYINSGAWTEPIPHFVHVRESGITLRAVSVASG